MRATALLVIALAALPFSCGTDAAPTGGLASGCKLTSECNAGLVCTFGRCHEECRTSVDCPRDGRCVTVSGDKHVCVLPQDDAQCTYNGMCPSPLVCAVDQRCRNECTTPRDCIEGQVCANTGVCADTSEVDGSGNLIGTEPGSGGSGGESGESGRGGSGGSAGSTIGGSSSGGTTGGSSSGGMGNGGTGGGEGGAGGEPCTRPLPGGGCSYCPTGACVHGMCVSGDAEGDYSCECSPGYSGTGTKLCTLANACEAVLGCEPAYPCVPTEMPGGYACQGQFATWPMPEAGGAVTPSYSGTAEIVLDNVTRLEWERVGHTDCTLSSGGAGVPCDWPGARDYCEELTLAGKSDWRLPTLIELQSLLDCTHSFQPLIDTTAFPTTPGARYWTASPVAGSTSAWAVDFSNCLGYPHDLTMAHSVRCVAGTGIQPDLALDHYTVDSADPETVLDNWTGLTWIRAVGAAPLSLADAETECSGFGSGFRVPTYKELVTLVDPGRLNPAIDRDAFPGATQNYVWASTSGIGSAALFYIVTFRDGSGAWNSSTAPYDVRCVKP